MKYRLEKRTDSGNWAAAEIEMDMMYEWGVTDTLPYYGHQQSPEQVAR